VETFVTPNAEKIHKLFRGSNEIVKTSKLVALSLDLCAGSLAVAGIFGTLKASWVPLFLLGLAVFSAIFRSLAAEVRSFAQKCRKTSLRAFSFGSDIDSTTTSDLAIDAPAFAELMAKIVPAQSLVDYYEPVSPEGETRFRELYAHSAFYTWRLLQVYSRIAFVWALIIFSISFGIIYNLAETSPQIEIRGAVIEGLCSVALVLLCVKAVEVAYAAHASSKETRQIEKSLLKGLVGVSLAEAADEYDLALAAGLDVPTSLYRLMRNKLQQQWHERRVAII
jgi:hypothetical protein